MRKRAGEERAETRTATRSAGEKLVVARPTYERRNVR